MSETAFQSQVMKLLERMGVWAFRVNSGGKRGRVRLAPAGTPDICLPALGWLELKVGDGELSEAQVAWHERAKKEGVRVAVCRTLDGVAGVVSEWRRS